MVSSDTLSNLLPSSAVSVWGKPLDRRHVSSEAPVLIPVLGKTPETTLEFVEPKAGVSQL